MVSSVNLQYFEPSEFREWWGDMSPRLLVMLDVLRHKIRAPIQISPNPKSLGRNLGLESHSDHNVDFWGHVLAVDCFVGGVYNRDSAANVIRQAHMIGLTSIGVYPDWINSQGQKQVGFHLGVRPTRKMGLPAEWGFIGSGQVTLETALGALSR